MKTRCVRRTCAQLCGCDASHPARYLVRCGVACKSVTGRSLSSEMARQCEQQVRNGTTPRYPPSLLQRARRELQIASQVVYSASIPSHFFFLRTNMETACLVGPGPRPIGARYPTCPTLAHSCRQLPVFSANNVRRNWTQCHACMENRERAHHAELSKKGILDVLRWSITLDDETHGTRCRSSFVPPPSADWPRQQSSHDEKIQLGEARQSE